MFKKLVLKLFLESLVEDDEPLDFGPVGPTVALDTPPETPSTEPSRSGPSLNFLGQPVTSELVIKALREYMSNIRRMLSSQFFSSITDKEVQKSMREFIRSTLLSKRNPSISPNINQNLFSGNKPEKFEAFLQEWLHIQYLRLLDKKSKEPSIKWSSQRIDLRDPNYVKELLGGKFWDNIKAKIFQSPDAGSLYDSFKSIYNAEIEKRDKDRERSANRRAAVPQVAEDDILSKLGSKVTNRFKDMYQKEVVEK